MTKTQPCKNIRKGLSDLFWRADHCGISLFYFSGHGLQDGYSSGYIAPHDVVQDEPFVAGIRMQELREMIVSAQNKDNVVVILDCCYSGVATEGKGETILAPEDPPVNEWFSTLEHENSGRGRVILASASKDEKSHEMRGSHELGKDDPHDHGAFTFHLLEGLDSTAKQPKRKM